MGLLRCALDRHAELNEAGRDAEASILLWQVVLLREAAEREIDGRPLEPVKAVLCTEPDMRYLN